VSTVHFWPLFAGQGHPVCWSNPMQTTGQVECKWVVKSMQLRTMVEVIFSVDDSLYLIVAVGEEVMARIKRLIFIFNDFGFIFNER
jgi:hypothetical protein